MLEDDDEYADEAAELDDLPYGDVEEQPEAADDIPTLGVNL